MVGSFERILVYNNNKNDNNVIAMKTLLRIMREKRVVFVVSIAWSVPLYEP